MSLHNELSAARSRRNKALSKVTRVLDRSSNVKHCIEAQAQFDAADNGLREVVGRVEAERVRENRLKFAPNNV